MNYDFLNGKTVLVTGGTGSFGNKFIETLLTKADCKKIIVLSRDEFKQHEMKQRFPNSEKKLRFFLGDIRDVSRLQRAFQGVDIVVHAAALKQVPALEFNPLEAVKTNVLGTQNVIDAALDNKVQKVLFVSTDKAVNPINLYGATKLCAEKLWIAANAYRPNREATSFSLVRYGNVVGSRGSIVEVLNNQKKNGVVTLTHEDMTRFWISLDQGVELVLYGLKKMKGGEIFLPKLPAMKISDLISSMAPGCEVKVVGIRPGEKLHEALMTEDEVRRAKDVGDYYLVEPNHDWWDGSHLKEFQALPEDMSYVSDRVDRLTHEDFIRLV
ncbi:MAG: UDP-N-acetylglucosamine 4,6-dehydratase (inverting) [bacterium]|nr:UDP-N-acetylglucosamine 4,6-dehydratase (inverting) [bacterium]